MAIDEEQLLNCLREGERSGISLMELEIEVDFDIDMFPLGHVEIDESGRLNYLPTSQTRLCVTLLGLAAACGLDRTVSFLLDHGFDVNSQPNEGGSTALFLALYCGHGQTAELLLRMGAEPDASCGYSALHAAARCGFNDIITKLIGEYKVDPNVEDLDGAVPILYALLLPQDQAIATISHLLKLGAETDILLLVGDVQWCIYDIRAVLRRGAERDMDLQGTRRMED
ncbi:Fc.00g081710.m01.CDS01 [Cosmosporella sp. VM-42]